MPASSSTIARLAVAASLLIALSCSAPQRVEVVAPPAPEPQAAPAPRPAPRKRSHPPPPHAAQPDAAKLTPLVHELLLDDGEPLTTDGLVFPDRYSELEGVFTFRGGPRRDGGAFGAAEAAERRLEIAWEFRTSAGKEPWGGGAGWTGEPVLVRWPAVIRNTMPLLSAPGPDLVEVIQGSLDGKVYFLDLKTGRPTRPPIDTGNPIKGSVSLDPRGYPLLFVGQGIPQDRPIGLRVYSLIDHRELYFLPGRDKEAPRRGWGAFDSSGLLNRLNDTYLVGGENGLLYLLRLGTRFDPIERTIAIAPQVLRYRFRREGNARFGIENSIAVSRNVAFFADNGGTVQALDLQSLEPLWSFAAGDDTDASLTVDLEDGRPVLYTGAEVDEQGERGRAWIRKLDGLSGEVKWERSYQCQGAREPKKIDSGVLATNVVGKDDLADLVVFTLARCPTLTGGLMVALDKASGREVWRRKLPDYSWSSPTAFRDAGGNTLLLQADVHGRLFLVEGRTGKLLHSVKLVGAVEASPAIFGDLAVVATRQQRVYGIRIR